MLPQNLSRNIIRHGGCNMYIRKLYLAVWAINFALVGMCGYIWGVHTGLNTEKPVDMQMQIRYAVAQAMMEGQ